MKVSDIKKVACVGGGVIGSSWAIQYAMRGLSVALYDINDEQLLKSRGQMEKSLDALVGHDAIAQTQKAEIVARVHPTTSMEEAVSDAQFIQESGPERLEIKRSPSGAGGAVRRVRRPIRQQHLRTADFRDRG